MRESIIIKESIEIDAGADAAAELSARAFGYNCRGCTPVDGLVYSRTGVRSWGGGGRRGRRRREIFREIGK